MGKRSRRRRHRSGKVEASQDPGDWVVIDGRRYFVAGYTPGGVPYGCFEDEFDESLQRNVEAPWRQEVSTGPAACHGATTARCERICEPNVAQQPS
jgi:hypothetical protein